MARECEVRGCRAAKGDCSTQDAQPHISGNLQPRRLSIFLQLADEASERRTVEHSTVPRSDARFGGGDGVTLGGEIVVDERLGMAVLGESPEQHGAWTFFHLAKSRLNKTERTPGMFFQ